MEQRPLRLGDIVDDYCPRERRVTNHAIVAIVDQAIRQTRCMTCDADHVYRGGRAPLHRRPKVLPTSEDGGLAAVPGQLVGSRPSEDVSRGADAPVLEIAASEDRPDGTPPGESTDLAAPVPEELGLHRRLIRATLPRVDGEPPVPRPIPEFTMHQRPQGRGGWSGHGHGRNNGHGRGAGGFGAGNGHHGQQAGKPGRHRSKNKRTR